MIVYQMTQLQMFKKSILGKTGQKNPKNEKFQHQLRKLDVMITEFVCFSFSMKMSLCDLRPRKLKNSLKSENLNLCKYDHLSAYLRKYGR